MSLFPRITPYINFHKLPCENPGDQLTGDDIVYHEILIYTVAGNKKMNIAMVIHTWRPLDMKI
jgi:hypothetical protein